MKQCPFKETAVQQQAARLVDKGNGAESQEAALKSARSTFGACTRGECQMFCSYDKEWAEEQGYEPGDGWCGLVKTE